jgi:protein-S-isoprenylcysteine O-methyltransferase Ste14
MNAMSICKDLWIVWIVLWLCFALRSKKTQRRESVRSILSYAVFSWIGAYLIFYRNSLGRWGQCNVLPLGKWISCTSVVLVALGFAITFWARVILGDNWSGTVTVKVDHTLIRSGPYRWVRHPIYSGLLLSIFGAMIALDQWRGFVALPLLWIAFTIKRLKEERFMRQTFGDQYAEYSKTTGAIVPLLLRQSS